MPINLSSNFLLSASLPLDQRTVAADIATRNAIPAIQRFQGLTCYVLSGTSGIPENWQLQGGILNTHWVLVGGSGGVPIVRYISPTGNNTNDGLTALTPWQTPAYAISQISTLAPSSALINCASGTYTSVSFDAPSLKFNSDITFLGNETTPSSVIFQNLTTTSIVGVYDNSSILKLYGINFAGGGSNFAIFQDGGSLYLRNCTANGFYQFADISGGGTRCYIQGGLSDLNITNTDTGFALNNGATLYVSNNVHVTQSVSSLSSGTLYRIQNANFIPVGNNTHKLTCVPISGTGYLFSAGACFIYTGNFCDYIIENGTGLFDFSGTFLASGSNCNYTLTATDGWMQLKENSLLYDNATCSWGVSTVPLNKISLTNGSQIISPNYVTIGGIIIGDDLVDYLEFGTDTPRTRYNLDDRYYDTITFTCLGELPRGITTNDISPVGILSIPYQIYMARGKSQVESISIYTRIPNSTLLVITDTYTVYVNNVATAMLADVTTSTTGTSTASPITLNPGDRVCVRVTSDALTSAEDITVTVVIRRFG